MSHPTTPRLDRLTRLIERALAGALRPLPGTPRPLQEAMRYCVLSGGKRFRPLLCLGGCESAGGTIHRALTLACAIEFIHTYSLVHDDLPAMDNAEQRRGHASCHRRFGEATAILVGDALLTRAFELLSANGTPNTIAILRTLGRASGTTGLIGGQVLDLQDHGQRLKSTVKNLEEIARRKTAALITASVVAGGLAGGALPVALARLRRFGEQAGLAFQLIDDLHDQDGLVAVAGQAAVRGRAMQLIQHATRELRPFGSHAATLTDLADWLGRTAEAVS